MMRGFWASPITTSRKHWRQWLVATLIFSLVLALLVNTYRRITDGERYRATFYRNLISHGSWSVNEQRQRQFVALVTGATHTWDYATMWAEIWLCSRAHFASMGRITNLEDILRARPLPELVDVIEREDLAFVLSGISGAGKVLDYDASNNADTLGDSFLIVFGFSDATAAFGNLTTIPGKEAGARQPILTIDSRHFVLTQKGFDTLLPSKPYKSWSGTKRLNK